MGKRKRNKETLVIYAVMVVTAIIAVVIARKLGIKRSRSVFSILVGIEMALAVFVSKFLPQKEQNINGAPAYTPYEEVKSTAGKYVNEYVPETEKQSFAIPGMTERYKPDKWTINREKGCILFKYNADSGNPAEEHFAFVYAGTVIAMVLGGSEFAGSGMVKWKIKQISIPEKLNEDAVLAELREALAAYGCFGDPFGDERDMTDF